MQFKQFAIAALGASPSTPLYTAGAVETSLIRQLHISNTTAADVPVSVYLVPAGSSVGDGRALLKDVTVPAKGFISVPTFLVLEPLSAIHAAGAGATLSVAGVRQ